MTPTRSPRASASSWSWVTNRVVVPTLIWMRRISSRSWRRTFASSAESGSSRSRTLRLDRQRARQRDALLLAAGELVRIAVAVDAEADELEHLVGPSPPRRGVHPAQTQPVGDVVAGRHVREQAVGLEDHAHVAVVRRHLGDVLAVDEDPTGVGDVEPGERAQRRGLAAARRAQQRDQLTGRHLQVEPVEGVDRPVVSLQVRASARTRRAGPRRVVTAGDWDIKRPLLRWIPRPGVGRRRPRWRCRR